MINKTELDKILNVIPGYYEPKKLAHALSVERECAALADIYGMSCDDTLRLRAAALLHDITKRLIHTEQLEYCRANGIPFTEDETHMPKIFHARTGAHLARKLFPALVDDEMYDAIYYHTTAKPAMSLMCSLLYLADYIEPTRKFTDCVKLRGEFYGLLESRDKFEALNIALITSFNLTLTDLVAENGSIHVDIIEARNYYMQLTKGENI